jgi:hypothetical protein
MGARAKIQIAVTLQGVANPPIKIRNEDHG